MNELDFAPDAVAVAGIAGDAIGLLERLQQFRQPARPAVCEVDVLRVRDEEGRLEGLHAQRDDEGVVADLAGYFGGDLDFIAHALLLDRAGIGDEQHLAGAMAQCVFEFALPVLAALEPEHIGPDLVAHRGELRAQPDREGVVLGRGVADEDRLARFSVWVRASAWRL